MKCREPLGGVIHTYQKFDPVHFPSPTVPAPDLVGGAFEHMLVYGDMRELTEEELARAVRIDPGQIAGLGPSLDALIQMLLERKRKILATYRTDGVLKKAGRRFVDTAARLKPPKKMARRFAEAVSQEQLHDLERLWYVVSDQRDRFARGLVHLIDRLGDKYQVDELAARYTFTGRVDMTVEQGIQIKDELQRIDELLKQLEQARRTAQIVLIDLDELTEFAEPDQIENLSALQQQVQDLVRQLAEQ